MVAQIRDAISRIILIFRCAPSFVTRGSCVTSCGPEKLTRTTRLPSTLDADTYATDGDRRDALADGDGDPRTRRSSVLAVARRGRRSSSRETRRRRRTTTCLVVVDRGVQTPETHTRDRRDSRHADHGRRTTGRALRSLVQQAPGILTFAYKMALSV